MDRINGLENPEESGVARPAQEIPAPDMQPVPPEHTGHTASNENYGNHTGNMPDRNPAPDRAAGYPGSYPPPPDYFPGYAANYPPPPQYPGGYPMNYPPPPYGNYYQHGAFYGDRYAPRYVPPPPEPACPPPPPAKPIPMNRKIFVMASVIAGMIFVLCLYCIISDLLHGALGVTPAQSTVVLQMQEKPDLDPDDENVTADGEYTVKGVAELVTPSIVEVYVYQATDAETLSLSGTGSGIIISEDGYIITNAHVVQGDSFTVVMYDETEHEATLVGSDNKTDLAVLKINATNLTPAILGNSDEVSVGETVLAIGNPAGFTNTVTKGIVSAINRQVRSENNGFMMDCIQTDAAISPGNSGGALVNMYGQVIGITSSKYASVSTFEATYEGLGFAITINQALPMIQDLIENGYVTDRFRIGIVFIAGFEDYTAEQFLHTYGEEIPEELQEGLWITEISDECDISHTQLQPNDFILRINDEPVSDYDSVLAVLDGYKGGDTVTAKCARYENKKIRYFEITFRLEEDTSGDY